MAKLKHLKNQSMSVAVMLAVDNYNYNPDPKAISATTILRPLRMLQLEKLKGPDKRVLSVQDIVASRVGSAIHTMLEESWLNKEALNKSLKKLGYTKSKVAVNPDLKDVPKLKENNHIVVWVENYSERKVYKNTLTGTFDIAIEGVVEDLKNTSTFKIQKALQEMQGYFKAIDNLPRHKLTVKQYYEVIESIRERFPTLFDYGMQGSIYRFLNPNKIIEDFMYIQAIMKDWSKTKASKTLHYPATNPYQIGIPLFTPAEVEGWVHHKLKLLDLASMNNLAKCTNKELWMEDDTYKVYATAKSSRCVSGGTFKSLTKANEFNRKRKKMGIVKKVKGTPRRCEYCNVRNKCTQADAMGIPRHEVE